MLTYMLDTNICIYVMKTYPPSVRERFNALAEELCISSITLGELHYGAEKSARRAENLTAIEHFVARLEVLAFADKAAMHYGQVRAEAGRDAVRSARHADRRSRPQRGADRRHQHHARVRPHAGRAGGELAVIDRFLPVSHVSGIHDRVVGAAPSRVHGLLPEAESVDAGHRRPPERGPATG